MSDSHTQDTHDFGEAEVRSIINVLEQCSTQLGIAFSPARARRVVTDANLSRIKRSPETGVVEPVESLLDETAENFAMRIRRIECRFREVLSFLDQGSVVVTRYFDTSGTPQWLTILGRSGGRKYRVAIGNRHEKLTGGQLSSLLGITTRNEVRTWHVVQLAFPSEASAVPDSLKESSKHHLPPLSRLIRFLRPERQDIRIMFVFAVTIGSLSLATPLAVEAVVNTIAFGQYLQPLIVLSLILFTFLAFAAGLQALSTVVVETVQQRLFVRVVEDLAYRLPRVDASAIDKQHGPELVNRFFDVVNVQKVVAKLLLETLMLLIQTIIAMIVVAVYHPFLLGYSVVLVALMAFVVFVIGRRGTETAVQESIAKYATAAWLQELIRNPTAFKFHGSELALDRADELVVSYLDKRSSHFRVVLRQIVFALLIQTVAATVLLGLGGYLVMTGQLTLGQLVASELMIGVVVSSFAKLGKQLESYYDLLASIDELGELFDLPIESQDRLILVSSSKPMEVRLVDVALPTSKASKQLGKLDLSLASGGQYAIFGESGAGKSAMIDVIAGLRLPAAGCVLIDEVDTREIRAASLRGQIGLARQHEVFAGTMEENVHLGRTNMSVENVHNALQVVGLLELVLGLPDGMQTHLTTGGWPLSSGQVARLMIARAIVGNPRMVLIDGVLDGLGARELDFILERLTSSDRNYTLVVATCRRQIARRLDRIVSFSPIDPLPTSSSTSIPTRR